MKRKPKVCTVTPETMKVAAYIRVSTEEQAESRLGLEAQINQCRGMAAAKSWPDPVIYSDPGVSGAKELKDRPGMKQLIEDIKAGTVHALIISALDRIGRKANIIINFVEDLRQYNVNLVSCKESFDTSTPTGQFMVNIFAALAEMERSMIIERTKLALDARGKRDGDKGGRMPYGYTRIFELKEMNEKGCLVQRKVCVGIEVNKEEAEIVKKIFSLHRRGKSLREIAASISTDEKKWQHSSVAEILKNRDAYKGGNRGESDVHWPAIL